MVNRWGRWIFQFQIDVQDSGEKALRLQSCPQSSAHELIEIRKSVEHWIPSKTPANQRLAHFEDHWHRGVICRLIVMNQRARNRTDRHPAVLYRGAFLEAIERRIEVNDYLGTFGKEPRRGEQQESAYDESESDKHEHSDHSGIGLVAHFLRQ